MFFEKHPKISLGTSFFPLDWTSIIKDNVSIPRIINKSVMSAGIIRVRSSPVGIVLIRDRFILVPAKMSIRPHL